MRQESVLCMQRHFKGSVACVQEIEKEVWEKDASGRRKLRLVHETGYKYEADMEGRFCASVLTPSRICVSLSILQVPRHPGLANGCSLQERQKQ